MKRLAVFCDGTWNDKDNPDKLKTNVALLGEAVAPMDRDGIVQKVKYVSGVGTNGGSGLNGFADKFLGGVFGAGLNANIRTGFTWLIENYEPGDQIYIFGFSRGAYTARSLGGLLRSAGIPRGNGDLPKRIDRAFDWYRNRGRWTRPGSERSAAYRARNGSIVSTGQSEDEWRARVGRPPLKRLSVAYMGIWDTVGALGVPGILGPVAQVINTPYRFHDDELARMILSGRHAVAIDEQRVLYPPTLWSNLTELNGGLGHEPYRQRWYPGDHSMIGGSGPERGITNHTLRWIAKGAEEAGLIFDPDQIAAAGEPDHRGPLSNVQPSVWGRVLRKARTGPRLVTRISGPGLDRLRDGDALGIRYNPKTLRPLRRALAHLLGLPYREPRYPVPRPPVPRFPRPTDPEQ
ncbi:DUF2235 domain-containing protein [Actibacterium sp. 188UL27-1]|uniref:DUF2235 domain-containing protein n=1 Tax=Actibacterium sp. 188UL27-1 TaxID=2786961 RepID=UPI001956B59F|nr:DUF2235 domain-containing protein [Actibacterium sp. 188UL27-1]MBM7066684.1 DUF2235 domain-containing protein [Actibacterium sp. 188UL27-1]